MKLIQSQTLGSGAGSVAFTSIPQTYTDLIFMASARSNTTGSSTEPCLLSFNGDSSGYTAENLSGTGSGTNRTGIARIAFYAPRAGTTASSFSNGSIHIPNYTLAINKNYLSETVSANNGGECWQSILVGVWANTAAITSVTFTPTANNFEAGTMISLYGILKGTDGIVTTSP
jgi:hypothetical protein